MEWWEKLYTSEDYLSIFHPYITNNQTRIQIDFIIKNLPISKNDKILDLCCGTGRHTFELARRGFEVTGADWSCKYLSIAKRKAQKENIEINWVQGDMRTLCFKDAFDIVLNLFTSFGYFEDDDDNERVIHQISQALKPQGLFFFDFINLEPLLRFLNPIIYYQEPKSGAVIVRERSLDLFKWRLQEKCTIFFDKSDKKEYEISYRLYTLAEFTNMLRRYDLIFRNAFGDFDGRDVCENSPPRMIVIAQKK